MTRYWMLLFLFSPLSGCSILLERNAQYSEYALEEGHSREEIIAELGQPVCSRDLGEGRKCDVYRVSGRVFDSEQYWATRAGWPMTFGIHELVLFPKLLWEMVSEAVSPTEKALQICEHGGAVWWLNEIGNGSGCDE